METIKVKPWGEGQGDYVLINAEDFDEAVHARYGVESSDEGGDGSLSASQLKDELKKRNIEFRGNASRAVLQGLYDEAVKAEQSGENSDEGSNDGGEGD
jgi:hypothetical protein